MVGRRKGALPVFATRVSSAVGDWTIAVTDAGVLWIGRDAEGGPDAPPADFDAEVGRTIGRVDWRWEKRPDRTAPAVDALRRYFQGDSEALARLPVMPVGTPFQMAVWEACARIPFGATMTYGDLAMMAGFPGAARAVGGAMNRNPLPLLVPCHRVVASGGALGGYGLGGLPVKRWLLDHEAGRLP